MNISNQLYRGYRYPSEIVSHAIWLYHRFCLGFRDIEDLLAERGIVVSYETIRSWCNKFGPVYAGSIKNRRDSPGDTWYLDEVYFVTVRGERRYLWHAVDQDGDVLDILVQGRKDKKAAERFIKKLMKGQGRSASEIVTDKLPSYGAAKKAVMPTSMSLVEFLIGLLLRFLLICILCRLRRVTIDHFFNLPRLKTMCPAAEPHQSWSTKAKGLSFDWTASATDIFLGRKPKLS